MPQHVMRKIATNHSLPGTLYLQRTWQRVSATVCDGQVGGTIPIMTESTNLESDIWCQEPQVYLQAIPSQRHSLSGPRENTCNYRNISSSATLWMPGKVSVSPEVDVLPVHILDSNWFFLIKEHCCFYAKKGHWEEKSLGYIVVNWLLVHVHMHHTHTLQDKRHFCF